MIKELLIVCLVVSIPFAGCTDTNPPWFLTVRGEITEIDGQYQYNGEIELGGSPTDVTLTGVKITYLDANQSRLGTDHIGDLSNLHVEDILRNLSEMPRYVIVEADEINSPTNSNYQIEGAIVVEEQGRHVLYNNYTEYDPVY